MDSKNPHCLLYLSMTYLELFKINDAVMYLELSQQINDNVEVSIYLRTLILL
jgi:hypothetical protein